MSQDYNARFKEILSRLAPDKKKELYSRMHSLPAEEREGFIRDFVKKYDARKMPQKTEAPAKPRKKPDAKPVPHGKVPHKNETPGKPAEPVRKKVKPEKPAEPVRKKVKPDKPVKAPKETEVHETERSEEPKTSEQKENKSPLLSKIIVGILIALLGAGAIAITAINNHEDISKLLSIIRGETQPVETSATENEYKIAASLAVQTSGTAAETEATTPAPTPTPIVIKEDAPDLTGLVIVIDPGHQAETDDTEETLFPGATVGKPRCTSGAVGVDINTKEYEVTLEIALATKAYLEACGASVILTRETNDVNLSNQERADIAVAASPDIFIRIHADSVSDSEVSGVIAYVPDSGNYIETDKKLADSLGTLVAEAQGIDYLGCFSTNAYTGLNYSTSVKSVQLVVGFLSNSEDEARLNDDSNTYEIAAAIAEFCGEL
ncbi:MAG: N-acetylmuramoyl-L-alanine amidase [Clostridiales bacterium]|nr:N-acetylmuramoyl-L-alanine amidase [Clostridiales bacterium]